MTGACERCGDPIVGDPVHGQGGLADEGARQLADAETAAASVVFAFDDGPYCSLTCAIATTEGGETA